MLTADPTLRDIEAEVRAYPSVQVLTARDSWSEWSETTTLLVRCDLTLDEVELSLFTTLTTFGTPRDITLDELAIELFYPADEATEAVLRGG